MISNHFPKIEDSFVVMKIANGFVVKILMTMTTTSSISVKPASSRLTTGGVSRDRRRGTHRGLSIGHRTGSWSAGFRENTGPGSVCKAGNIGERIIDRCEIRIAVHHRDRRAFHVDCAG